ncbi:MAG: hypothetical protein ACOZF0_03990 [Thermodesulfobacteriota bacterium]
MVLESLSDPGPGGHPEILLVPTTLARRYDPLVVPGDLLPQFHGTRIENLRLFAHDGNRFKVIPFQIDERDPEGEFILTNGKASGRDVDKGRFDYNDEMVLMAKDAGGQVLPTAWETLGDRGMEIIVSDPRDASRKGWIYLIHFPENAPPMSPTDYVEYLPEKEIVRSAYYRLKYRKGAPFYMDIVYPESAGGNGRDFFDRIKVRLSVDAFFHLIHIHKTEEDFKSLVIGWKDGPVRVLRRVENHFRILFNLSSPSIFSINEYYERLTYTPVQLTIPFRLKWVFNTFGINDWTWKIYGDFPGLKGGMAYTDRNRDGFRFTGNHSPDYFTNNIDLSRFQWGFNTKAGVGAWFPNLLLPEMLYGIITLHVVDDERFLDPPDDVPGLIGGGMKGCWEEFNPDLMRKLEPGTYELSLDTYFPHPTLQIADVEEWLQIRDFPLWLEIGETRISPRASKSGKDDYPVVAAAFGAAAEEQGFRGRLTDTRGREFDLHQIYFYSGSYRVTPRTNILGRVFTREEYKLLPFEEIRRLDHGFEARDPVSEMGRPMVQTLVMRNGEVVKLLGCKPCGFSGRLPDGRKLFLWNTQIRSLVFLEQEEAPRP